MLIKSEAPSLNSRGNTPSRPFNGTFRCGDQRLAHQVSWMPLLTVALLRFMVVFLCGTDCQAGIYRSRELV